MWMAGQRIWVANEICQLEYSKHLDLHFRWYPVEDLHARTTFTICIIVNIYLLSNFGSLIGMSFIPSHQRHSNLELSLPCHEPIPLHYIMHQPQHHLNMQKVFTKFLFQIKPDILNPC